jgi:hypothetical protein
MKNKNTHYLSQICVCSEFIINATHCETFKITIKSFGVYTKSEILLWHAVSLFCLCYENAYVPLETPGPAQRIFRLLVKQIGIFPGSVT